MAVYPHRIIKNSDVSKVRKLNVDSMLVGYFQVIECLSWKFIVTSLSISCRPLKERICSPAVKLFLYEQTPLGRVALSGECRQNVTKFVPT